MKLRCPYCRQVFEKQNRKVCPQCGKIMRIPNSLRKEPREHKPRLRASVERHVRSTTGRRATNPPRTIIAAVLALAVTGALLVMKTGAPTPQTIMDLDGLAKRQLLFMGVALTRLNEDCGRYPTTEEGLDALISDPGITNWTGPYVETLMKDTWRDPWGRRYTYSFVSNRVSLLTAGPDGQFGTDDDLVCPHFRLTEEDRVNDTLRRRAEQEKLSTATGEPGTRP